MIDPVTLGAGALAGLAALAGLGWALVRRGRRDDAETARARASLEDAVAHLVLGAEGLGDDGRELQERAVRLQQELRRLPAGEDARTRIARIQQLEDEVVALQSQVLARRRESEG